MHDHKAAQKCKHGRRSGYTSLRGEFHEIPPPSPFASRFIEAVLMGLCTAHVHSASAGLPNRAAIWARAPCHPACMTSLICGLPTRTFLETPPSRGGVALFRAGHTLLWLAWKLAQEARVWPAAGQLQAVRVGQRRVRIKRSDFDRLLDEGYSREGLGLTLTLVTVTLGLKHGGATRSLPRHSSPCLARATSRGRTSGVPAERRSQPAGSTTRVAHSDEPRSRVGIRNGGQPAFRCPLPHC
jgi:hypothetical protein